MSGKRSRGVRSSPSALLPVTLAACSIYGTACAEGGQSFARVDTVAKRTWIEKMIRYRSWNDSRYTRCEQVPLQVGTSDYGHVRCWRRYCDGPTDCRFGETCMAPEAGRMKRCIEGSLSPP